MASAYWAKQAPSLLATELRAERQSARMSKITNDDLTRSGTGCCIAVRYHMATVCVEWLMLLHWQRHIINTANETKFGAETHIVSWVEQTERDGLVLDEDVALTDSPQKTFKRRQEWRQYHAGDETSQRKQQLATISPRHSINILSKLK